MIWLVLALVFIIAGIVGLYTRDLRKVLIAGMTTLITGVVLSLIIVYSGIMGG